MAKLVCRAGPDAGHEYPLRKDKYVFGRRSTCEVPILDSMASREHFVIRREGQLFTISDLESRNGTKVNGRKITERQLEFDDVICVGEVEWLFVKEDGDVGLKDLLTSKYEIMEKVGEGGMGIVYKALQRSMDRTVALKVLAPKYAARPKFVNQFIEEARAAGRLNHPNIIQVHDVDTENNIHYFSMEYIDGATCMQLLRSRGPFPPAEALEISRLTAKALQYAHEQRIIHRDIKPDNIMIGPGSMVKLADLGISKTFDEAEAEDQAKRIVGTPHYMAPEAALGRRIDHRVDIYSLGATLFQLLTARTVFTQASAADLLKAHVKQVPPRVDDLKSDIPGPVADLVAHLLAKDPDARPASAQVVIDAIEELQRNPGLAPQMASGGETQLLRRFAAGVATDAATAGDFSAGGSSTGSSGAAAATRTRTATGPRPKPAASGVVKPILILIVLILAGLAGWQVMLRLQRQPLPPPPGLGQASRPTPPAQQSNPAPSPAADPKQAQTAQHRAALDRVASGLAAATETSRQKEIRDELDRLTLVIFDEDLRQRLSDLRQRLDQIAEHQQQQQRDVRLRQLQGEIEALLAEDDWHTALDRLKAFEAATDASSDTTLLALRRDIERARDAYISATSAKLKILSLRGDAAGLRQLQQQLPESLLEHELAARLQAAVNAAEATALATFEQSLARVEAALASWDLATSRAAARAALEEFSQPTYQQELQKLHDAAATLLELPARLQAGLQERTADGTVIKYKGMLAGMEEPYLIGATDRGVQVKISTGTAQAPWSQLSKNEYAQVILRSLGDIPPDVKTALEVFFYVRAKRRTGGGGG